MVKTEPHRNQNKLLSSGITILLLDTSVHVRCYIFHLQNDIKPPKVADKKVTPELEVTLTWHGSTLIKGVLPCWGVRVPSLSVLQGRSFLPCLQKLEILLAILHNPLHAAAACESPHGSLCGVLLWCTADISEIHHVWIACIFRDLLAGWRTRSLWPCKLGIRDGVFSHNSILLVITLWSELTFQNILGNFYELVKSPDIHYKIKKLPISPQESGANIQPEASLLTAFVVCLSLG